MILATVETANFTFQTLAADEKSARKQLLSAWRRHCKSYPAAQAGFMAGLLAQDGEVNFVALELGDVTRDGEVF